jgi:hypothetical protein
MVKILRKTALVLAVTITLALPYLLCSCDNSKEDGYELCVNTSYGYCGTDTTAKCGKLLDGSGEISASGEEVFSCFKLQLPTPSTMTVSFEYKASASTCWREPYLEITAKDQSQSFRFDCNGSGSASITIEIASNLTISDINFLLSSGDWGSWVIIKSITFSS